MPVEVIELAGGDEASASVIVLHGLGADGRDFVPVCRALDLGAVGPVRFVLPTAPERPVTRNGGYIMRAWFDLFEPGSGREDEAGLRDSMGIVESLVERERVRGVRSDRIVLMGFSQGCGLALATGLRHGQRLAALIGLSGYLPLARSLTAERSPANRDVPVWLAHGEQDTVVAIERGRNARDALFSLGYMPAWQTYSMGHEVCGGEIGDISRFLRKILA